MSVAECPSCSTLVDVGDRPKLGQLVKCGACASELEVVWLDPVELDWPIDGDEAYYEDEEYAYYDED